MTDFSSDVEKSYRELTTSLTTFFPQFQSATTRLVEQLRRQNLELQQREERHNQEVRNYENRVKDLEDENRSLRRDKADYENLKREHEQQMRHLDAYSQKIDALESERTELISRCDHLKSELANSHQQVKDYDEALNRQNVEHAKSLQELQLEKHVELSNQATDHRDQMEKTNNNFKSALKRLEVEIDERNGQIRAQKTDIANLKVKLDQLPSILAANMVKTTQQLPQKKNINLIPPQFHYEKRRISTTNPAKEMRRAVEGSSLSSSISSLSSQSSSRRRLLNVDPINQRSKRLR